AHELQLERLLPVFFGEVEDLAAGRGAGVVDEDVDAAEARGGRVDDALGVVGPRQIAGHREHLGAGRSRQLFRRGLERVLAAGADRDTRPFLGEPARDGFADAFAAARHQRHLALQAEIHGTLSFVVAGWTLASLSDSLGRYPLPS